MQGHIVQTSHPPLQCFNCEKEGHFAQNCCQGQQSRANLIDFNNSQSDTILTPPEDHIIQLLAEIESMNMEDRVKLAQGMGVAKDFPTA